MESGMCSIKPEFDDVEELMEFRFEPIKVEPGYEEISEEPVKEEKFEATKNPEKMAYSEYAVKINANHTEISMERPFASLKAEPGFEGVLEETIVKENFEENEVTKGSFTTSNHEPSVQLVEPEASDAFSVPEINRLSTCRRKQKLILRNISEEESFQEMNHEAHIKSSKASCGSRIASSVTHPPLVRQKQCICALCGKTFKRGGDFTRHMRTHTGERPFKCHMCGKTFKENGALTPHMRTHTGKTPFKCCECGKKFAQCKNLSMHIMTHTGEKPFKCLHCEKAFKSKGELKNHLRTHTGERPYECSKCGKSFSLRSGIIRHVKIHSRENP